MAEVSEEQKTEPLQVEAEESEVTEAPSPAEKASEEGSSAPVTEEQRKEEEPWQQILTRLDEMEKELKRLKRQSKSSPKTPNQVESEDVEVKTLAVTSPPATQAKPKRRLVARAARPRKKLPRPKRRAVKRKAQPPSSPR